MDYRAVIQQGEVMSETQYGPDPSETVDTNAGEDAETGHVAEADEEESRKTADAPTGGKGGNGGPDYPMDEGKS
jgi:hypothetical protein